MTTRVKGFIVSLEDNMRDDDAAEVVNAIRMVKYVARVDSIEAGASDFVTRARTKDKIRNKLYALIKEMDENP